MCGSRYYTGGRYYYDVCPGYGGNIAFLVIFGLIFFAQLLQGIYWKQWWFAAWWFCGCGLQAAALACRVAEYYAIYQTMARRADFVCSYLAPAFQLIGVYYLLSKLTTVYGRRYSAIAPTVNWWLFTGAGIVSLALLAGGAGFYASPHYYYSSVNAAWIILAGLIVQLITMTVFIIFFCILTHRVRSDKSRNYSPEWHHVRSRSFLRWLIPAMFVALLSLYIQTIARIVTLFTGWGTTYDMVGILSLVFDTIVMALASFILTVVHPGTCFGRNPIPIRTSQHEPASISAKGSTSHDEFYNVSMNP